jgi:hypothetical protein
VQPPTRCAASGGLGDSRGGRLPNAIEPLVRHLGPTLTMFGGHGNRATPAAHDLLDL